MGLVVAQIAPYFSDDHRHGIGTELYAQADIKIVDGFDQSDTADLKKIVRVFAAVVKALDNPKHQSEIAADKFLSGRFVALFHSREERFLFLGCKCRKLRGIDSADFNLVHHESLPPDPYKRQHGRFSKKIL